MQTTYKTFLIVAARILVIQAITILGVWQIYSFINPYNDVTTTQALSDIQVGK